MQAPENAPIFVLAGGQRTGSTLLQRLLISTREVMIWGEHDGLVVPGLRRIAVGMKDWYATSYAPDHLAGFRRGDTRWIPNINPDRSVFDDAMREFFLVALARPAAGMGYPRWGFKEVRYGITELRFLRGLFPEASFLLLVRDPRDCLRSIKSVKWPKVDVMPGGPASFMKKWAKLSGELAEAAGKYDRTLLLRYEDLVGDPGASAARIAKLCGLSEAALRQSPALSQVEKGPTKPAEPFTAEDLAALGLPEVEAAAKTLGYRAVPQDANSAER